MSIFLTLEIALLCFTAKKKRQKLRINKGQVKSNNKNKSLIMPQLIPFYFFNQILFSFIVLFTIVFIFSKYVLPQFTFQQVIRLYITKLSNKG